MARRLAPGGNVEFNVATLLQEPVGSTRQMDVEDERIAVPEAGYVANASGRVLLMRTQRGVLVHADVFVKPSLECARCLETFELPLSLVIDEEFVPERDPVTGAEIETDPDEFRIDERNHLDLSEAVRQYEEAALPIQPVCREDCAGLCPVCGQNRNIRACDCTPSEAEGPLSSLASLAERLRAEEERGGTKEADSPGQARHAP